MLWNLSTLSRAHFNWSCWCIWLYSVLFLFVLFPFFPFFCFWTGFVFWEFFVCLFFLEELTYFCVCFYFVVVGELGHGWRTIGRGGSGPKGEHSEKLLLYDTGRGTSVETESGGSSEPHVKDSGIDTGLSSSNQTLYEEWARHKVLLFPICSWFRLHCLLIMAQTVPDLDPKCFVTRWSMSSSWPDLSSQLWLSS